MGKPDRKHQEALDKGDFGKSLEYDYKFAGPRGRRSCTDILCLLLFLCFIVAWIVIGILAFKWGDPIKLVAPFDTLGNQCGVDPTVEDKPYLFYFDITTCLNLDPTKKCDTPKVCLQKCPDDLYPYTTNETICVPGTDVCAEWYIPTKSVAQRCLIMQFNHPDLEQFLEEHNLDIIEIRNGSREAQLISQVKEVGESIIHDLRETWPLLLGGLAIAMVLCLIYIIIMRWFAWIFVWASLLGVVALLSFCCYASWVKYQELKDQDNEFKSLESIKSLKETWLVFFIVSVVLLVIVIVLLLFLRNRIRIAIALISEASRAVGSVTSTLAFPIVPWLLQISVIAWAVAVGIHLASSSSPVFKFRTNETLEEREECDPSQWNDCNTTTTTTTTSTSTCDLKCEFANYDTKPYIAYLHAVNIFGFFWGLFFMSAFGEMALAGTFSTWYWTYKKSDVPFFTLTYSIGRTIRYHLGTLAFGSLILAICRIIRVILEYTDRRLRKYNNGFVKAIMCCLRCFFWCLEKFIKFINRNAYIMCAVHGKNFCASAKDAFNLLMRNIIRVFVVDKVTDFLLFMGKLLITGTMVALAFYVFHEDLSIVEDQDIVKVPEVNYYLLPVILIGIGTYFVASVFFGVYAMAVDTLFLCFLEDLERNDGSPERPYYMSKSLMKILGKKNKKYKET